MKSRYTAISVSSGLSRGFNGDTAPYPHSFELRFSLFSLADLCFALYS